MVVGSSALQPVTQNVFEGDMMSEAEFGESDSQPLNQQPSDGKPWDQQPWVDLIRERPWACVLGAAAVGFVIARLVRTERE